MIGYYVPHNVFPAGYHCDPKQPLPFAALASQKNYLSLYLMGVYCGCAEGPGAVETAQWTLAELRRIGRRQLVQVRLVDFADGGVDERRVSSADANAFEAAVVLGAQLLPAIHQFLADFADN